MLEEMASALAAATAAWQAQFTLAMADEAACRARLAAVGGLRLFDKGQQTCNSDTPSEPACRRGGQASTASPPTKDPYRSPWLQQRRQR